MPTVLSKHKGELLGKRINVKVNSRSYICQKVQMVHLTGLGVVVENNKLSYNKNVYKVSVLASHNISCMKKRTIILTGSNNTAHFSLKFNHNVNKNSLPICN